MPENPSEPIIRPDIRRYPELLRSLDPDADEEVPILDETGRECGWFTWKLITSEEKMWAKDFAFHREQIPLAEVWPVAFISHLEIRPAYRKRDLGTKGLREFLTLARTRGARSGYLRIGWDSDEDLAWKRSWYRREGWVELENSDRKCTVPFMYHALGQR